ncbi:MAG: peptidoglycan recognition family protein [Candidatus Zixiibacteriota bacterium]
MAIEINYSLRLDERNFIPEKSPKDLIVLHHTVSGSARGTFNWWQNRHRRIATAYIIEKDGTVFELFDPCCWAFHLGLRGTGGVVDRRSIGIELVNWGGLTESDGKLYRLDRIEKKYEFKSDYYQHHESYRGYQYFEKYSESQNNSTIALTHYLSKEFNIPIIFPQNSSKYHKKFNQLTGIWGHCHFREDKSDPHPGFDWNLFKDTFCQGSKISIRPRVP